MLRSAGLYRGIRALKAPSSSDARLKGGHSGRSRKLVHTAGRCHIEIQRGARTVTAAEPLPNDVRKSCERSTSMMRTNLAKARAAGSITTSGTPTLADLLPMGRLPEAWSAPPPVRHRA